MRIRHVIALAALTITPLAHAHNLWIENTKQGAYLYYGEYEEGLLEVSPGLLDKFPGPKAKVVRAGGAEERAVRKETDRFALGKPVQAGEALLVEEPGYDTWDLSKSNQGVVKPMFYLRYAPTLARAEPQLPLDLTPTGKTGELLLSFKGQPLPKTRVKITAPHGWTLEAYSNEHGIVQIGLPWRGNYILEASHTETAAGEFAGKAYDKTRHFISFSLAQPSGDKTFTPQRKRAEPKKTN